MFLIRNIDSLRISRHYIPPYGPFPNCRPTNQPLIIYHQVFPPGSVSLIQRHLCQKRVVEPQWVHSMYREHHFHSTTHEVLVISKGSALLCFGGKENPDRVEYEAKQGDVLVVPAGLAHALLEDKGGFEMVGSYPIGADRWDHCTATSGEEMDVVEKRIKGLAWFRMDPVYGNRGPLFVEEET